MLPRRMFREKADQTGLSKHQTSSLSTQESLSPENVPKNQFQTKEKSELCRKFMEFGYCPYQRNCKFAHGSHQLKKNNNLNSKYKTKECGAFIHDCQCRFGDRCNFIHRQGAYEVKQRQMNNWKNALTEYREIFYEMKEQSKLSHLFQ